MTLFEDAYFCKFCIGTGQCSVDDTLIECPECGGSGLVPEEYWHKQKYSHTAGERFPYNWGPASQETVNSRFAFPDTKGS